MIPDDKYRVSFEGSGASHILRYLFPEANEEMELFIEDAQFELHDNPARAGLSHEELEETYGVFALKHGLTIPCQQEK